ncbi:hypothetical protein Q8A67_007045 [Cirrhinus molitorella]|uniref:Uncharacterized protein n=1 Tax=Cirrhinus molitorella TaxID=172907 RepID=A0AA88TTE7_9TELE|nr:hypothetical protein Q8A67_007045 [Cirrhinus molitorella]
MGVKVFRYRTCPRLFTASPECSASGRIAEIAVYQNIDLHTSLKSWSISVTETFQTCRLKQSLDYWKIFTGDIDWESKS